MLETFLDKAEPPAFIFLDINMPGMDGFEFLEIYQSFAGRTSLAYTAGGTFLIYESRDIERAYDNPVVDQYLNKPCSKRI